MKYSIRTSDTTAPGLEQCGWAALEYGHRRKEKRTERGSEGSTAITAAGAAAAPLRRRSPLHVAS